MTEKCSIALFPLRTVLIPGGLISLKVFEPRYLSMVAKCMRSQQGFGVVLIREGSTASKVVTLHEVGTLAHIIDFDQLEDGNLGILCSAEARFRIIRYWLQADQLLMADVELLPETVPAVLPKKYPEMKVVLQRFLRNQKYEGHFSDRGPETEDTRWVSYRLMEYLALSHEVAQELLEMNMADRLQRLEWMLRDYFE